MHAFINLFLAVTKFAGSLLFGFPSFWLLRYLPEPLKDELVKKAGKKGKYKT